MQHPVLILLSTLCLTLVSPAISFSRPAIPPGAAAGSADWTASSAPEQARLVELYTSQGCSSCPPADRWLADMKSRKDLWRALVPVAWHVTYWDYLGWSDPFGSRDNDNRQRRMAARAGAGVYTPGVFVDQRAWQGWRRAAPGQPAGAGEPVGVLSAESRDGIIRIEFKAADHLALEAPVVELVFMQGDLTTPVAAGENRGRRLTHNFAAGKLSRLPLRGRQSVWTGQLERGAGAEAKAVALWILDRNGRYLQATGSWLPGR